VRSDQAASGRFLRFFTAVADVVHGRSHLLSRRVWDEALHRSDRKSFNPFKAGY
jgi:hypothetical protein